MTALVPRSLAGRLMLVLGLALFVAQLANFALILNEREKLGLVKSVGPAVTRFASAAADVTEAAPEFRGAVVADLSHRGARYSLADTSRVEEGQRSVEVEAKLAEALTSENVTVRAVRATEAADLPSGLREGRIVGARRSLRLAAQLPSGAWLSGDLAAPARDPWLTTRLGLATIVLFLLVFGASFFVVRQVARPLQALTSAARDFRGKARPDPVKPAGPVDVRDAIEAFNAMNARLLQLLDDKDRVLGAIGHDLRTPLASLRIRLETMEPEEERVAAIRKLDEMASTLEDILMLAQAGRSRGDMRRADVTSIVDAAVEEFRDLGRPVTFEADGPHVLSVHPTLVRRAVSNLIDNALKYGGKAAVTVMCPQDTLTIAVADDGPGIDPTLLARVLEPFFRGEESRNRLTGGAGLGLAITKSVADIHRGEMTLQNIAGGGLKAELRLPVERS